MAQDKGFITLKLTPEQQEQVRKATGKVGDTLEFSIMELEERIAPSLKFGLEVKAAVAQMSGRSPLRREGTMAQDKGSITLKLTPEQQERVRKATASSGTRWSSASWSWRSGSRRASRWK